MYRTILNPYPIRTSRVSAPYSRIANPRTVVGDVDVFRLARDISGDTYRPSTLLSNPSQLADPELRGGEALFPNLRVGKFGREALAEDLTPYRVAKMFRPDVINMTSTNPARQVKASEDIQFQKAGQSPGQAKALGELIRKDPVLEDSFNIGYGSTLNREQGLAQKEGRVYEFDPTDEMWKSGFKRKNPSIVAMDDLQDALMTMPSGSRLTTYDGRPLDPSFTKTYYSFDTTQDINDPQLFYNLKGKADVDYGRIAQALDSVPKDVNKKADYSLAKRWERVQDYSPYPPSGATYVLNADKPYQSIDEIMAEVNQVEPWRTPRMADSRIARSQNSGNSDFNIIPKDYTRKEYLEATGDSDNLPPLDYAPNNTVYQTFQGLDTRGKSYTPNQLLGNPIAEVKSIDRVTGKVIGAKTIRNAPEVIYEDRTFLLNSPTSQAPVRAMASVLPPGYYSQRERDIPTGIRQLDLFNNTDPYLRMAVDENNNPIYRSELPANYYGTQRDIPTTLSAIEEGLTGRKGSIVGYANVQRKQRPTTRLGVQTLGEDYYNPYRESYGKGETTLSDNLYLRNFSEDPNNVYSTALAWDESNPNIANYPRRISEYYRLPSQSYSVGRRDNLPMYVTKDGEERYFKTFTSPEVVLPKELTYRGRSELGMMPSSYSPKQSPNQYRIAGSTAPQSGYREFNEVMDEGIQASRDLDRLYPLNDELAYLGDIAKSDDMYADILGYEQSEILDKIVDAERIAENMGGLQRRLSGKNDQGSFEQERMAYEGRPSVVTQYNVDDVLEPSFGSDYSGRANTGRIRVPSGIDYDAGIPIPTSRTRLASGAIDPIKLQDDFVESFNQAQYTRDLIDRGGVLIDTQLGIPILKAPTTAYNPITQRNESYLQPVRPSRVANGVANWQAPESLAVGRVGKQIPIQNIPELSTDTGMTVERRASSPMASIQRELMNDNSVSLSPWFKAPLPSRDINTSQRMLPIIIGEQLGIPRKAQFPQGQILYPNAGIGPINTGLKPKPTIGELFGFTAITPEGLAKYRDMS